MHDLCTSMGISKPMKDTCARLINRLPNLRVDCNEPPWSLDLIQKKKKKLKWEFNAWLKILIKSFLKKKKKNFIIINQVQLLYFVH